MTFPTFTTREKYASAVKMMATMKGSMVDRLGCAAMAIVPGYRGDLPPRLEAEHLSIKAELTRRDDANLGELGGTLHGMTHRELSDLATRICDLNIEIQRLRKDQ